MWTVCGCWRCTSANDLRAVLPSRLAFRAIVSGVGALHAASFRGSRTVMHLQRSALQCGNQFKWVSGTLRTTFLPKVGFAMPPNYAFKPTAGEVIRTNQPLLAGGGLTRR
jgi:hypothetical protein